MIDFSGVAEMPPVAMGVRAGRSAVAMLQRPLWWMAVGYCGLLLVAYQAPRGVAFLDIIAGPVQYLPLCLMAAIAFAVAARRAGAIAPRTRGALVLLAAGLLLFSAGMALYTWSHVVEGSALGTPVIGDLFYLPGYVLVLVALLRLPARRHGTYHTWQFALDAGVVLVGVGLVAWYLVILPTAGSASSGSSIAVTLAYPVLGLGFLLALNGLLLRGGPLDRPGAFGWLALSLLLYVVADSGYQLLYYGPGTPIPLLERLDEAGYALAYLGLVSAGLCYASEAPQRRRTSDVDFHSVSPLPLLVTAVVVLLLGMTAVEEWSAVSSPLMLGLVMITMLLMLRQGMTSRQHAALLQAESQRKGDQRVAALVRHASDLIVVTEPDGRIRFASPSLEGVLGFLPAAVAGVPLRTLVDPEDRAAFVAALPTEAGRKAMFTTRLQHSDGTVRECDVVATDLCDEPAIGGIVYVARDLSERRALEHRLQQAQKMESVGRLAGGIAHDFNNLLTTILAETEMLLDPGFGGTVPREDLATIHDAAQHASALTRQLLAFSRRQVTLARPVDLADLLDSTLRIFGRSPTRVEIRRHAEPGLPPAMVDPHQISQVLLNLLINARDAMPEGGTITISMASLELTRPSQSTTLAAPPGRYIEVVVADTGIGMDATTRERVFEPFFTTKASGRGTGLGLPSVLSTIEQHGGGLSLLSAPGAGTRISLLLPEAEAPEATPEAEAARAAVPEIRGGRERILLVDDEESVRDVTRRILERLGYEVESAASAQQARRVIAVAGCPDLLLTDVIMPDETGPQLAEALVASCPTLRVLYISGYTGDELQQQGTLRPGIAFLQKPYTPRELGEHVRRMFDGGEPPPGAGAGENGAKVRS